MSASTLHEARLPRLRLLWVKAGRLLPLDTGGKLRSYHLAKQLASRHELTLLTYYDGPADAQYERQMRDEFPTALTLRSGVKLGRAAELSRYLARLPHRAPFAVTKFHSRAVEDLVTEDARHKRYDAIICDFLSASLNFRAAHGTPLLLFQHNVEAALWWRQARHAPNLATRIAFTLEARKMQRYERRTATRFDHVIAVSEHDRRLMSAYMDPERITVVPTGVDTTRFRAARDVRAVAPVAMFLGSMDWEPNIDGVRWLCAEIWPRVLAAVPTARLRIVGRDPTTQVRRLASDSVEVTGTVPSIEEYLAQAAVVVVPLRVGGGTRLKIFEAMAAGRAVVSTTVGAEGLQVEDGRDLLVADDAEAFADAVIRVLREEVLRERLRRGALEVVNRYDWSSVVTHFEAAIARVLQEPRQAGLVSSGAPR